MTGKQSSDRKSAGPACKRKKIDVLRKTVEEGGYASYKFYRVNAVA
jgi:hypothetical protein